MIKNGEKELYRIFNDLKLHGRTTFKYPDYKKQQKVALNIGMRVKPLVTRDLMLPPAKTRQSRLNIVALPLNVKLIEKKESSGSRFYFQRKKYI